MLSNATSLLPPDPTYLPPATSCYLTLPTCLLLSNLPPATCSLVLPATHCCLPSFCYAKLPTYAAYLCYLRLPPATSCYLLLPSNATSCYQMLLNATCSSPPTPEPETQVQLVMSSIAWSCWLLYASCPEHSASNPRQRRRAPMSGLWMV